MRNRRKNSFVISGLNKQDRPKSALYIKLKLAELQKVKVLIFWGPFGEKHCWEKSHKAEKTERVDPLGFFNIPSVTKLQKN